jgi:hypothetical protein
MAEVTDDIRETVRESYASAAKADASSPLGLRAARWNRSPRLCVVVEDTNRVVIFVMSGNPNRMSFELQNSKTPTWLARGPWSHHAPEVTGSVSRFRRIVTA